MLRRRAAAIAAGLAITTFAVAEYSGSYIVPLDHPAIGYSKGPADDAITRLEAKIKSGEVKLAFDREGKGYLPAALQALGVPVESQVLVFSKTSFQAPKISPRMPRALYFNDEVAVGWVRGGDVMEFAAVDPRQGVVFYTLDQEEQGTPRFERNDTCLQCHQSGSTVGVPGFVVRSVYPNADGMPLLQAGSFVTDHRSPFKERWGGWYVTGSHGGMRHMGNAIARGDERVELDQENSQNVTELGTRVDTGGYLSPHSDIVALMVLEHQTRMTNLITRVGWEARMALQLQGEMNRMLGRPGEMGESTQRRINSGVEELLGYMLFAGEFRLESPVEGTSGFAQKFAAAGPRDGKGRSLRDFDLQTRMFRYPCSYMIYSEAFDKLPPEVEQRLGARLWEVLSGQDRDARFSHLSSDTRTAIREILEETKPSLAEQWPERAGTR